MVHAGNGKRTQRTRQVVGVRKKQRTFVGHELFVGEAQLGGGGRELLARRVARRLRAVLLGDGLGKGRGELVDLALQAAPLLGQLPLQVRPQRRQRLV